MSSALAIKFIESHCRVPDGKFAGDPVRLRDWQIEILEGIFDSPTRTAIISFGRKNAKTTLAAMIVLLHLVGPMSRINGQVYSTAQSRKQAKLLHALAAKMIRMSPTLNEYVGVRDHAGELYVPQRGTQYEALSADKNTSLGQSPFLAVHDELGQVSGPRSVLYENVESGMGAHDNPLSVIISTQAPTDADLLSVLIDDAKTDADPETKLFLWTSEPDADPFDRKTIVQANPALGDFLNESEVLKQAENARRMPAREARYRNLVLNQRISAETPYISAPVWKANGGAPSAKAFREQPVYCGLDLSTRLDLTALALCVKDTEGVVHVRVEFFAPKDGVEERSIRDRVPYDVWARQGHLTLTPGKSVDYEWVATRLGQLAEEYDIAELRYDRWHIDHLRRECERIGLDLPLVEHGQGYKDMSPAVDALETALINERIRHGGHPILTWCASNAIAVEDPAKNRKLDKAKSTGRIDGLVALVMAMAGIDGEDSGVIEGRVIAI